MTAIRGLSNTKITQKRRPITAPFLFAVTLLPTYKHPCLPRHIRLAPAIVLGVSIPAVPIDVSRDGEATTASAIDCGDFNPFY